MEKTVIPSVLYVILLMKRLHSFYQNAQNSQIEYKQVRHDNIAKMIHWKLYEKWGFSKAEK